MKEKVSRFTLKAVSGATSGRTRRFIQPCLLALLLCRPSHGYELMDDLKKKGFLKRDPDAGAVYRALRAFEKEGLVRSKWDTGQKGAAKRIYEITPSGKRFLRDWVRVIKANRDSLGRFLRFYDKHAKHE